MAKSSETSGLRDLVSKTRRERKHKSAKKAAATAKERYGDDFHARLGQRRQAQLRGQDYAASRPGARVWIPGPDAEVLIQWLEETRMMLFGLDPRRDVLYAHIERLKRAFPKEEG